MFSSHYDEHFNFQNHLTVTLPEPDLSHKDKGHLGFFTELVHILWKNRIGFIRDPMHA